MLNTEQEIALLKHILATYRAILVEGAELYQHREGIMGGILMRETLGGKSKLLKDVFGTPDNPADDVGNNGHGRGLFQIDDRSFPEFCTGEKWKDPRLNGLFAAEVLAKKRQAIQILARRKSLRVPDLERASIAGYNCGEGKVLQALAQKMDVDTYTAHANYSADVLRYARMYQELAHA
ncbi:MAG: hypothetical protein LAP85_25245 [Acidobacteriia bacterium]|nr:hypothetical protein [Terriglobia bacterium]